MSWDDESDTRAANPTASTVRVNFFMCLIPSSPLVLLCFTAVRLYCCDLAEDVVALRTTLHHTVEMLATVTVQRDRLRDQNRQLREWNDQLTDNDREVAA